MDETGGPFSKYAALFDSRPEFDNLRVSFLHATCGKNLERLADSLGEYLESGTVIDADGIAAVLQYLEECRAHFGVATCFR